MAENALSFLPYIKRQPPLQIQRNVSGQLSATLNLEILDKDGNSESLSPHELTLRGPGDVIGIAEKMIARREPKPNTFDFEPNYFPFVEFVDPDFPWRYSLDIINSLSSSDLPGRVHPWLSLIILSHTEINEMASENIEVIAPLDNKRVFLAAKVKYLPSLDYAWSTAHGQFVSLDRSIEQFLEASPSNHCSRLFCFRRLQPKTRYVAFLVPNYSIAVQAAFGLTTETISDEKAWQSLDEADIIKLPIYSYWQFGTSEKGDFESLAQALKPYELDSDKVGIRAVDANLMTSSIDPNLQHFFLREGALAAPGFSEKRLPFSEGSENLPLTVPLLNSLNESLKTSAEPLDPDATDDEDPLITFPVYGRYFRKTNEIMLPNNNQWPSETPWIHEANLDFRNRVAGGFGTKVTQINQDEYMKKCWLQVGEIREANEKIRRSQAAVLLSEFIEKKHFCHLSDERFAMLSSPFHSHYAINQSGKSVMVKKAVRKTDVSTGVFATDFRRIAHRRININRTTPIKAFEKVMSERLPMFAQSARLGTKKYAEYTAEYLNLNFGLQGDPPLRKSEVIGVESVDFGNEFRALFNAKKAIKAKLDFSINFQNGQTVSDNFDQIMVAPKIQDAMNRQLSALSEDYILPGIENLENNGVTLCEENRGFIEPFMVGLNHEMGRELLWRHYPTDLRGTIFHFFWDPTQFNNEDSQRDLQQGPPPDIKEIHQWVSILGRNKDQVPSEPNLVLVIKGDLIRRYPATIIYAVKISSPGSDPPQPKFWSEIYPQENPPVDKDTLIQPIFRSNVGDDILFVGFPFSLKNVRGPQRDGEYYFVLQENQDLPRFGLDVASERINQNTAAAQIDINDFRWSDAPLDHAGYISGFEFLGANTDTSAKIANKTYQLPIRVAIHASELLP